MTAQVHYQRAEVTLDSFADTPVHCSHYRYGIVLCPPSPPERRDQDIWVIIPMFQRLSWTSVKDDSQAAWTAGLLHPGLKPCQVAHTGSAVGSEVCGDSTRRTCQLFPGFRGDYKTSVVVAARPQMVQ